MVNMTMQRFCKYLGTLLLVSISSLLIFFFAYDLIWFQPNQEPLKNTLKTLNSECASATPQLAKTIKVAFPQNLAIAELIAQYSISETYPNIHNLPLGWHSDSLMWTLLTDFHYSEKQEISVLCAILWNGEDRGLNEYSLRKYEKPLSQLSQSEIAVVVANSYAPGYYKDHPEALDKRAAAVFQKVISAYNDVSE